MAQLPKSTYTFVDSNGFEATRTYVWKAGPVAQDVIDLGAVVAALTKLGLVSATLTTPIAVAQTVPDAAASRAIEWLLTVKKSLLGQGRGGKYSFTMLDPIDALRLPGGLIDTSSGLIHSFLENFDDGAGLAGIAGDLFVSDGEMIVESTAAGDNIISAKILRD